MITILQKIATYLGSLQKKILGLLKSQILGIALLSHLFPLLFRDRFEKRNLERKLGLFPLFLSRKRTKNEKKK